MRKSFHLWKLAFAGAVSLLIVSCCGGNDYRNMLPADAFMAMSLNAEALAQKSNACDMEQSLIYPRIKEAIETTEGLSAEQREYYLSLLKNPGQSGVDLKRDMFYFVSMDGDSAYSMKLFFGMLLPLADRAQLDEFITHVNSVSGTTVEVVGGVSMIVIGEEDGLSPLLAYNDMACMLCFGQLAPEAMRQRVLGLFSQKQNESLMGNKAVAEQLAARNDINAVISYRGMSSIIKNNPLLSSMPVAEALKDATMLASMNFEKGRIVSEAAMAYDNKESEKKMTEFYSYLKSQKGDLLRYVPASSIGTFSLGLDGEKLFQLLSGIPGYSMLLANPVAKQVLEAFDGDFLIAFSGLTPGANYPVASLMAQVDDPGVMQTIVNNLGGMPLTKVGEGEYLLNLSGISAFFGVKDKMLYFTTDAAVNSALGGAKLESLTAIDKIVKGENVTFYLDFEGLNGLLGQVLGPQMDQPQTQAAMSVLGMFEDMEVYCTVKSGKLVVNMVDKEHNALETISCKAGDLVRRYMPEEGM